MKYGCIKDEKFRKQVEDLIIYRTTLGADKPAEEAPKVEVQSEGDDAWSNVDEDTNSEPFTTLQEYLDRNKEKHENKVFYCNDPSTQGTYVELYKNQGLEVIFLDSFIDTNYFVPFLEREKSDVQFSRVDSELDDTLVEEDKAQDIVDPATNKTRNDTIKEVFEKALNKPQVNIKTQAIKSDAETTPPAMVLLPEAMRRLQEMTALMQEKAMEFPDSHILLINTSHPLIQNILDLNKGSIVDAAGKSSNEDFVNMMCLHIYDLALMAQKAFDAEGMKTFVERSNKVLTKLTEK